MKVYTLDTSSIIEISKLPEDVLPGFWSVLTTIRKQDRLFSPREVIRELKKRTGWKKTHEWATKKLDLFVEIDPSYSVVITELDARFPGWIDPTPLEGDADPLVVALAESKKRALRCDSFVISEESPANQAGSFKIPDVCRDMGLGCGGFWEILRQEGVKL
jgi:Domain of unknown function (DUF4411)